MLYYIIMTKIEIDNCYYNIHPFYDLYGAKNGYIVNIIKKTPIKGNCNHRGYMICMVRKHAQRGQKTMQVHRFVWECFNGIIPDDKVIDHINDNAKDNRLCNLKLVTHQENCKKCAENRDYSFVKNNHLNKKCIKAINQVTGEVSYYKSMYATQQCLDINAGIIKMVCENINKCKTGISKKDKQRYIFEYINADELPNN